MPLPEGLKNLLSKQGVPGWVITGLALGLFCWTIASNLSTGAFILNLLSWLSDPTHAPTISMWADRLAKWGPIPLFLVGLAWLFYVATHPKAAKPATGHDNQTADRIEGTRNDLTLEEMRAQVAEADARAAEENGQEQLRQRDIERSEVEEVRVVYRQALGRAVERACETAIDELLLARAHGNPIYMLIRRMLNAFPVPPCRHAKARLSSDLAVQAVAPLETIIADLLCLLTKYGVLIKYLEDAALAILGPQDLYRSEGYRGSEARIGLYQMHRTLLQRMDALCDRTAFQRVRPALAPLFDLFTVQPLAADPPHSAPSDQLPSG